MSEESRRHDRGLVLFRPGTAPAAKARGIAFFVFFCLLILAASFYWLFANSVEPIVLGMPFGMFVVVLMIAVEFAALLLLYYLEDRGKKGGGTRP